MTALRAPFEATNQIQLATKIKACKLDPLPAQYSEELFKAIKWMMSLEMETRPTVEEIMPHPKISHFLKEQSMKEMIHSYQRREEELQKKDKMIKKKEQDLDKQLKELEEKDKMLKDWEERLLARKASLQQSNNAQTVLLTNHVPLIAEKQSKIEESPKISTSLSRRPESGRRTSGTSQSRDAIPSRDNGRYGLDNVKNNEVYMSNDNLYAGRTFDRNQHSATRENPISSHASGLNRQSSAN
jgi:hypothetical protein